MMTDEAAALGGSADLWTHRAPIPCLCSFTMTASEEMTNLEQNPNCFAFLTASLSRHSKVLTSMLPGTLKVLIRYLQGTYNSEDTTHTWGHILHWYFL